MTAEYHASGSLANLLVWRAIERPEFPFLYVEQLGPWTAGGLAAAAAALSTALQRRGVGSGDRVLIRLGNDERFLPALTAVWLRGASAIAMHPAAPAGDSKRTVTEMGARAVVGDPDDPSSSRTGVPFVAMSGVAEHGNPGALVVPDVSDDDEALVLLTSGSSGAPKGVVLTHGNAWSNLAATVSAFRRDTRITLIPEDHKPPNLIANPVSHTAGVVRLLFALYVGRSVVLLRKFDPTAAKAAIDLHRIDNLTINPTMMRMLLEGLPPDADLGPVRYASSGTAPLPSTLREAFEDRFGVPVLQAYGQTEAFGGIAIENVKEVLAGRRRPGSVGRALPGVELRIVTDGHDAPPGEEGEIRIRTKSATRSYIGDAGAEAPVDDDGWLRTGDLGHLDDDGYLYITGRLKNVIICGGFNVVPEELQSALMTVPAVREAAVVGVPDDRLGEVPVAVIESDVSGEEILASVASMLAPYKRPRRVVVVEALPRVPNGKVDLRACTALVTKPA
ncbi:MAG TPA: fatty acid--CoA ligase family protein [Acidimicrobiales bacterium]|nr:fatty acid--CoA ligase family protein [Acidimicrobiales bacterium]